MSLLPGLNERVDWETLPIFCDGADKRSRNQGLKIQRTGNPPHCKRVIVKTFISAEIPPAARFSLQRAAKSVFKLHRDDDRGVIMLAHIEGVRGHVLTGVPGGYSQRSIAATIYSLAGVEDFKAELDGYDIVFYAVDENDK